MKLPARVSLAKFDVTFYVADMNLTDPSDGTMNALVFFFGCRRCSAVYQATQQRSDSRKLDSFACRNCGVVVHSWRAPYSYTGFRIFDPDTGRAAGSDRQGVVH